MADFVAVLKKTVEGLSENTPDVRARVYAKARATIEAKLAAINPPPPAAVVERQRAALEDAIAAVEQTYAPPAVEETDALDDFFGTYGASDAQSGADQPAQDSEPEYPRSDVSDEQAPFVERSRATPTLPVVDPLAAATIPERREPGDVSYHAVGDEHSDDDLERTPQTDEDQADLIALAGDRRGETRRGAHGKRGISGALVAAVIALLVIGGAGYAVWINQDAFSQLVGIGQGTDPADVAEGTDIPDDIAANNEPVASEPAEGEAAAPPAETPAATEQPEQMAAATPEDGEQPAAAAAPAGEPLRKYTQRLQADGSETDPGPANGGLSIGEGTSVAELSQAGEGEQPTAPATPDSQAPVAAPTAPAPASAPAAQVAVGQRAIFYQERTSSSAASADSGSIVWSLVQESPGGDAGPENAIRAEVSVPAKELQLRMTIRRNADPTLPASHIMEMIFLTPDGFEGGGIENVVRVALKDTEQATGSPLLGIPARIADGFFLVALSDSPAEIQANMNLMRRQDWIDIPLIYKSGRRALITLEKGIPGERVFEEALKTWQTGTSG